MGMITPVRALWVVLIASPIVAFLCLLPWARVTIYADFIGPISDGVPGTQMDNLASFGDGTVVLLLAMTTFALAALGLQTSDVRRAAGLGSAVGGLAMFGIAVYDSLNVGGVNAYGTASYGFPELRLTIVPYFVAGISLVISLAGAAALLLPESAKQPDHERVVESELVVCKIDRIGLATQMALRAIVWACSAMAFLAFVPWFDAHSARIITSESPVVMTALGDAVLFSSVAMVCALLASQMLRDPSELVWAGLVVAGGAMFVIAGSVIAETTQGCAANGTILGFLNTNILGSCGRSSAYELAPGTAVGWAALVISSIVALSALTLPIIETVSRAGSSEDEAWA